MNLIQIKSIALKNNTLSDRHKLLSMEIKLSGLEKELNSQLVKN